MLLDPVERMFGGPAEERYRPRVLPAPQRVDAQRAVGRDEAGVQLQAGLPRLYAFAALSPSREQSAAGVKGLCVLGEIAGQAVGQAEDLLAERRGLRTGRGRGLVDGERDRFAGPPGALGRNPPARRHDRGRRERDESPPAQTAPPSPARKSGIAAPAPDTPRPPISHHETTPPSVALRQYLRRARRGEPGTASALSGAPNLRPDAFQSRLASIIASDRQTGNCRVSGFSCGDDEGGDNLVGARTRPCR